MTRVPFDRRHLALAVLVILVACVAVVGDGGLESAPRVDIDDVSPFGEVAAGEPIDVVPTPAPRDEASPQPPEDGEEGRDATDDPPTAALDGVDERTQPRDDDRSRVRRVSLRPPQRTGPVVQVTEPARLDAADAVPGFRHADRFRVANVGDSDGTLRVGFDAIVDAENGLTDVEALVDDDATGDLSEVLLVRVAILEPSGDRTYLLGDGASHVPLADAGLSRGWVLEPAEAVTVLVEYRIPPSAGDDIQTDGVTFDVAFSLADVAE